MKRHLASCTLLAIVFGVLALAPIDAQSGGPGQSTAKFHRKGARAIPQKYIVVLDDDVRALTPDVGTAVTG